MGKSKDAFRTISEVADWLDTQAHVLRFWESKFTQVKPVKRAGGRRYYRPADMRLLAGIKKLLHDDGMTIKGAQKLLREKGVKHVAALSPPLDDEVEDAAAALPPTEVQPPAMTPPPPPDPTPAEVVDFAQPAEAADPEPEDLSEMEGDLFPVHPVDASEPEDVPEQEATEETLAPAEEPDDLPSQDELPAFLQRVTFDTAPGAEAEDAELEEHEPEEPVSESEPEPVHAETEVEAAPVTAEEPVTAPEPEPTPAEPQSADERSATDSAPAAPTDQRSMEPAPSILPNLAATQEIAAENRAEAQALLAQLAALRARMAESENA